MNIKSPVVESREECVAGQQTGAGLSHIRRETATAVQLRNRKSQTCRWNRVTLTREFTQKRRHEARNAPSPAFHWHLFCAAAVQPTARGSPPRPKRVHPYARSSSSSPNTLLQLMCLDFVLTGGARPSSQHSIFFCLSTCLRVARFLRQIALQRCGRSLSFSFRVCTKASRSEEFGSQQQQSSSFPAPPRVWTSSIFSPSRFPTQVQDASSPHM